MGDLPGWVKSNPLSPSLFPDLSLLSGRKPLTAFSYGETQPGLI